MKENSFIYLRGFKHAAFTVFCVEDGQKSYYDPQFNVRVPFASGQQVKRSILEQLNDVLGVQPSPTEFFFDVDKKGALKEGEVLSSCDPHYVDQLLGGWMRTPKGGKEKAVKRRSPFSISAMTPLHPLLAAVSKENISFDRWIPDNSRATGLFVYDVAIDLRRLFCVSTNQLEPEITSEMVEKLKEDGWKVITTSFGECLLMPKEQREQIIPAIADALIDWHITSNQARTFSLMETLAIAISDNANTLAAAIRAKLVEDGESKPKAKPIVDENAGAKTFITLPCASYVVTETESADALAKAKQELVDRMMAFDYENQI